MINVAASSPPRASAIAELSRRSLDELMTYATHLVGEPEKALSYVAAALHHAGRYPPAKIETDGRIALFRHTTRTCRQQNAYPPSTRGLARLWRRPQQVLPEEVDAEAAMRVNTVKRALNTLPFENRAALLLRARFHFNYREIGVILETSPDTVARSLASARRAFGNVYQAITI